jgi:hypothetical protein
VLLRFILVYFIVGRSALPIGEAKQDVHDGFKNIGGMENVIGAIDGSHIGLANAPLKQPETYWNRKKRYSIQLQGIVDHRGMFIDYEIRGLAQFMTLKFIRIHIFIRMFLKLLKETNFYLEILHILYLPF